MFLQETKTKRGGKTYISYLVRESFRTANGPRGRTICNLTHLPKEVREMVAEALKGNLLVPIERLEVNNIHCFGGCVVLEDAARRHGLVEWLEPMTPRNSGLVRAMVFGGLLTAPSVTPFHVEARATRLAMFCGLDSERERFDSADLSAALKELDEKWSDVRRHLQSEARAISLFRTSQTGRHGEISAIGLGADGIPVPLIRETDQAVDHWLQQISRQSKSGPPLLALDEETAERIHVRRMQGQPYLIEMAPESFAALLRQLNQAQLAHALRTGGPVEVRHHGERYMLTPANAREAEPRHESLRMGSLKELTALAGERKAESPAAAKPGNGAPGPFRCVTTNLSPERLTAAAAVDWAEHARTARAAFAPVQIIGQPSSASGAPAWRNDQNLLFLTHRLRCQMHADWSARGETRPVEEVLRDLQEVHRATLTVDGVVVRRLATHPPKAVSALLDRLSLWELFETPERAARR
jgi:hypothetical protein